MKKTLLFLAIGIIVFTSFKNQTEKEIQLEDKRINEVKNDKVAAPSFEMLWETDSIFKTPESCLFNAERHVIYVSNVNSDPRKKDNNGFISTLSKDGKLIKLDWITGLSAPKGMGIYKDVLYVTDIDEIVEIDLNREVISKKHKVEGVTMLNDIAVNQKDGTVYVSAMDTHKIYSLKDGKVAFWKENIIGPNGLFVLDDQLMVASFEEETLTSYNINTKLKEKQYATKLGKADGVEQLSSGAFVVSDWMGEIFLVKNNKTTSIYNTKDQKIQSADIGIIKDENVILVPTFFENKVKAFKLLE